MSFGPRSALLCAAAVLASLGLFAAARRALREPAFATEEVRWKSGAVEIAGTLYSPAAPGPHAAAAFVHGAGAWTRAEPLFRVHAERLAALGMAVLIYDKRGCGASGGELDAATFEDLAADARGAVVLLAARPGVDPQRIGLLATSQGGAVALLAASHEPAIAFLVTLSLSTLSPAAQAESYVETDLRAAGRSDQEIAEALELCRRIQQVYRTDSGWDEARARIEAARARPWFAHARLELLPRESSAWRALQKLPMDFDPLPHLLAFQRPHFAAQGADDTEVPGPRAAQTLERLAAEHDLDLTVRLIQGAGHTLRTRAGWPLERWTWPSEYWNALEEWLAAHRLLPPR